VVAKLIPGVNGFIINISFICVMCASVNSDFKIVYPFGPTYVFSVFKSVKTVSFFSRGFLVGGFWFGGFLFGGFLRQ